MAVDTLHFDLTVRATAEHVRAAADLLENSGIPAMLADWEAQDRLREGRRGGRPAWATPAQMLTLLLVLARLNRAQTLSNMAALLCGGLTDAGHERLGLHPGETDVRAVYFRLQRSFRRMNQVMDPHREHTDRRRKLSAGEFDMIERRADQARRARNLERQQAFTSAMLLATFWAMPAEVRSRYQGNIAVDGTFVPAYGKHGSYRSSDVKGIEPYADWYVRDGEHALDPRASAKPGERKKISWGWEASLAVMFTNDPTRADTFPNLVLGMALDKPSRTPGVNAIKAIAPIAVAGLPTGYLVGDRAYGNTPKPEDFQRPARAAGYGLLYDMKKADRGVTYMFNGAVMLEGNAYSPAILGHPELVSATRDFWDGDGTGTRIDEDTYRARINARTRFLVQFRTAAKADGSRQGLCPAAGPNPTLACPLRPRGIEDAPRTLMPVMRSAVPPQDARGGLCSNAGGTMVLRGEVWERHAMDLQFGTRAYRAGRQTIEGRNALLKSDSGPQIAAAGRRRVRGQAALVVFLTTLIAAHNLLLIERFCARDVVVDSRGRGSTRATELRRRDKTWGPLAARRAARAPGKVDAA